MAITSLTSTRRGFYTGVGSRQTPPEMQTLLTRLAALLEQQGWILRSGGADGADLAFERGVTSPTMCEIYLPWRSFNGHQAPPGATQERGLVLASDDRFAAALELAAHVHPAWQYLKPAVKKLHARNAFQVLGLDLATPSRFLVCWTADGAQSEAEGTSKTGGTRTAIVLAERHGVPVFNLAREASLERVRAWIDADSLKQQAAAQRPRA